MRREKWLFEQVCTFEALVAAAHRAMRGKRRKAHVAAFWRDLEPQVLRLQRELEDGSYRPGLYHTFTVSDPKERTICAADFRDRVVHHALCAVLEPVFERSFIFDSYACRKGKGTHAALARAQRFCRRFRYYLKFDVRRFFDSVDHEVLRTLIRRRIADPRVLDLNGTILGQPVPWTPPGKGLPIGNLTSQHFANLYLDPLDHLIKDDLGMKGYIRYMDDGVLFSEDKAALQEAAGVVETFLRDRLLLDVREGSVILAPVTEGLPFLGFRTFPGLLRIDRRGWRRFVRRIERREREYLCGDIDERTLVSSAASLLGHVRSGDTRNLRAAYFAHREPLLE